MARYIIHSVSKFLPHQLLLTSLYVILYGILFRVLFRPEIMEILFFAASPVLSNVILFELRGRMSIFLKSLIKYILVSFESFFPTVTS